MTETNETSQVSFFLTNNDINVLNFDYHSTEAPSVNLTIGHCLKSNLVISEKIPTVLI